ncbi:MAG: hypothetical protein ABI724_03440 [Betaproteobacteria bacterium]
MKPNLPPLSPITHFIAATLAGIVTVGLFAGVTDLFQHDGKPMERIVAAERACVGHAYVSEREACVRQRLAATPIVSVASRSPTGVECGTQAAH